MQLLIVIYYITNNSCFYCMLCIKNRSTSFSPQYNVSFMVCLLWNLYSGQFKTPQMWFVYS